MSDFYSAVIFLSVFIMVIMDMLVSSNDLLERDQKQTIYTVSVLVIAGAVSEWLGVWMGGADVSLRTLHVLVKAIELSTAPVITVLCCDLITPLKHKKVVYTLIGIHAGLEVLSAFFGFIFSVDAQNVCHHEAFYWVYVLAYVSGVLLFIFQLLGESAHHCGLRRTLVIILPVFFFCGLIIQYMTKSVRIAWLCSAVDILMVYLLYSELIQKSDALTHLLNRRSYESRLSSLREHAVIYYFDVDEFKSINDTYGHIVGDEVLSEVGGTIYAVFTRVGCCYRTGGDEFCVIAQISDMAAEKYLSSFLHELTVRRAKNERLPHVSAGYACFDPVRSSVEDVIERADQMMYYCKRKLKGALEANG